MLIAFIKHNLTDDKIDAMSAQQLHQILYPAGIPLGEEVENPNVLVGLVGWCGFIRPGSPGSKRLVSTCASALACNYAFLSLLS